MRIIHITASMDPASGGPPAVVAGLAGAQDALGHDVSIAAMHVPAENAAPGESFEKLNDLPSLDAVHCIELPTPRTRWDRLTARSAAAPLNAALRDADIAHCHGVWEPMLLRAAAAARQHNVPYVVAPHGMLDPWSLQQKWLKKRVALALFHRRMLERAAFLHVLNSDEERLIDPLKLRVPRCVLPNGVCLDAIDALLNQEAQASDECKWKRPYVLFLSRLHHKKGLDLLIDAFASVTRFMDNVSLVIAGPDAGARPAVEERVQALGLTERVHLAGPVYGADKYALIKNAACFCLPSRQEGFSVAILEALACARPVVISQACHFSDVAAHGAGREVSLDVEDLAAALSAVLQDEGAAEAMGQAGRRLIEAQFTWSVIAERAVELYQAVLDGRSPLVATK